MLRTAEPTASSSLVMLPLGRLLSALQRQIISELDTYLFQVTLQTDAKLHAVFAEARQQIEEYLKKSTLMGLQSAFKGFEGLISDNCYEPANSLTLQQRNTLIELVKVYKAYAVQQFGIQESIKQIEDLEFGSTFYVKADRRRAAAEAILLDASSEAIIRSLHEAIASFDVEHAAKDNEIVNGYKDRLTQANTSVFQQLDADYEAFRQEVEGVQRQECVSINTETLNLGSQFIHDLPDKIQEATIWAGQCNRRLAALNKRKHEASIPAQLAEVEKDIQKFATEYEAKRDEFLAFEKTLNQTLTRLRRKQQQYLTDIQAVKDRLTLSVKKIIDAVNAPDKYTPLPLRISNIGYQAKSLACFQQVEKAWSDNEKLKLAVRSKLEDIAELTSSINEYLKQSLNARATKQTSTENIERFETRWDDIVTHYRAVLDAKISIDGIQLDKKQLEEIKQRVNLTETKLTQIRRISLETEISCIQNDAQNRYVSLHPKLAALYKRLEAPENRYTDLSDDLFSRIWDELQVQYDLAATARAEKFKQVVDRLTILNRDINNFRPDFLELPDKPAVVMDAKVVSQLDAQVKKLRVANQLKPVRDDVAPTNKVSPPSVVVEVKPVRQQRSFLRRHWTSLLAATGVGCVAGAGIGFALGWFFAPVTLGLSVPVLAGIGAAAGALVGGTVGLAGSTAACAIWDRCKRPAQTGSVVQKVSVSPPRQAPSPPPAALRSYEGPIRAKAGSSPRLFQPAVTASDHQDPQLRRGQGYGYNS